MEYKKEIDTFDVASKLSFLVGRTVVFEKECRCSHAAARVNSVKAKNSPGTLGYPFIDICTSIGNIRILHSIEFRDILLLESDGSLNSLEEYADKMGIIF